MTLNTVSVFGILKEARVFKCIFTVHSAIRYFVKCPVNMSSHVTAFKDCKFICIRKAADGYKLFVKELFKICRSNIIIVSILEPIRKTQSCRKLAKGLYPKTLCLPEVCLKQITK